MALFRAESLASQGTYDSSISCFIALTDLALDLVPVAGDIGPGVDQVGGPECREGTQDLSFGQSEPPVMLQRPHRDACARDPRVTTTDPGGRLDTGAKPGQELLDRRRHLLRPSF